MATELASGPHVLPSALVAVLMRHKRRLIEYLFGLDTRFNLQVMSIRVIASRMWKTSCY